MKETVGLSARQERAIAALLTERTLREAAVKARCSEATIYRWLSEPVFAAYYREAQEDCFERAMESLKQITEEAVSTLRNVLSNRSAKPSEQVSAARAILEFAFKSREAIELENRLVALEAIMPQGPREFAA